MSVRPVRQLAARNRPIGTVAGMAELPDIDPAHNATGESGVTNEHHPASSEPGTAGWLRVRGARVHNLKNIDVSLPKGRLVVCCGLSGSGKSSLAFDTIFAEGQRRYVESLSSYARQFLGSMDKPDVDAVDGLSPAISIDQKSSSHNPRSTVGTVTEIWDYLRLLFARAGTPHCPDCGEALRSWSVDEIVERVIAHQDGQDVQVLAPLVRRRKGTQADTLGELTAKGFTRVRLDGVLVRLDTFTGPETLPEKNKPHDLDVFVDRLTVTAERRARLADAVSTALATGDGQVVVVTDSSEDTFSTRAACSTCGTSLGEMEPRLFSFNSPIGACPACDGLGSSDEPHPELIIPDPTRSLADGAIVPWADSSGTKHFHRLLTAVVAKHGGSMDTPWEKLPARTRKAVLNGDETVVVRTRFETRWEHRDYDAAHEGVVPWLRRRYDAAAGADDRLSQFFRPVPCDACQGRRLAPIPSAVRVGGRTIVEIAEATVTDSLAFFRQLDLAGARAEIAERVVRETTERLGFLEEVGLGYLTLSRTATTLSGGEAQRIRLASQIGSGLTGILYVLDEPSIGLHQRDNEALLRTLTRLRDLGNTVLVVEHDEDTIDRADWIVEIGPRAGELGGQVVYSGPREGFTDAEHSVTAQYLTGALQIATPTTRRSGSGEWLTVRGASANNLREIDVAFPLGRLTAVTGVSGSGKSTLVNDVFAAALSRRLHRSVVVPGRHRGLEGVEHVDKLVVIDQAPIGRTPRSNPATYTGVFDKIRTLFADTPGSRERGWSAGRFSFNVPTRNGGGRCEACQGDGTLTIEMSFLPNVYVQCEACKGSRFSSETLTVRYKDRTIADVLTMSIADALTFFEHTPTIRRHLETLVSVGLGYVRLGQPATTLSGGEAQRVKLASELLKRATGRTVYVLDEPTTGLHFDDVARLVEVLDRLVDAGNSVVVIEHNLDVVRRADWVIDLGPEGGPGGGEIVAMGTPEDVAAQPGSHTGRFLTLALEAAARRAAHNPDTTD